MGVQERASTDEQRTSPTLGERRKGCLDVAIAAGFDNDEFLSDRVRGRLYISSLALRFTHARSRLEASWRSRAPQSRLAWAQAGAAAQAASFLASPTPSSSSSGT